MSRGLGRFQYQLLVVVAGSQLLFHKLVTVCRLQVFWPPPKPRFNRANIYRGLHASAHRGLVSMTDQTSAEPSKRWSRSHRGYDRGHDVPKRRQRWGVAMTEAGWRLVDETDVRRVMTWFLDWGKPPDEPCADHK